MKQPSINFDAMIGPRDLTEFRKHLRKRGLKPASLDLFEREVLLGAYIGTRFEVLRRLLQKNGLPESSMETVLHAATRMLMEPLLVLDHAHRRLWLDLLPTETLQTQWRQCLGIGRVRRRTFAQVAWDPKHVQTVRPDLSEFRAKLFLEFREIAIATAMTNAGWAAIISLLKEEHMGGNP